MGHVDDTHQAEHHGQTEGGEHQHRTDGQPVEERVKKSCHGDPRRRDNKGSKEKGGIWVPPIKDINAEAEIQSLNLPASGRFWVWSQV
ncbi:hypothetical protein LBMAG41_18350 [Cyanobium sp.]|nr:hypothetical protein LBMAG41_18350 [Cyanobium sp.]